MAYYPSPVVVTTPRSGGCAGQLIGVIIVLLVLVGGSFAAWKFYLDPTLCNSSPLFDRHGLQSNIALPSQCHFSLVRPFSDGGKNLGDAWIWTVESPNDPATLKTFYTSHLPGDGWTQKPLATNPNSGDIGLLYCQGNQVLEVYLGSAIKDDLGGPIDVTAPAGGSVLGILVFTDSRAVQQACAAQ